jgi:hypothetical protein
MQNLLSVPSFWHGTSPLGKASIALVSVYYAEGPSSRDASASRYSTLKDVVIFSVIEPIGKLVQVKRKILAADVVVRPDDAPLEQAPERIKVVGVDVSMYILASGMMYLLVAITEPAEIAIAAPLICSYQVHLVANRFGDKIIQGLFICAFNDSANHATLAGDRPDNPRLSAAPRDVAFLVPMTVLVLAADESFIYFYDTHELLEVRVHHSRAESVAHIPRGLMGGADLSGDLERTDALLAVEHLPEHFKPRLEMNVGIFKDSAHRNREAIGGPLGWCAGLADPMPRARCEMINFGVPATWAPHAILPATLHQELLAGVIVREAFHKLFECHHNLSVIII